ncbi:MULTISPECIES: oligosaccharide flippase family protein [unclassified Providencia]|uniref:oligosaccharide flippase family protein n=1 Tax=unclassified Providencia TaxID=2633465 RepID=UPI00234ACA8E|nr:MULTISPECIES: oligosaccharide flippase family protein [unclassified Providencia]
MFNKKIVSNFSYLSLIQIITLLVPFIYYPYLIRKYNIADYGLVVFIQSIIMLLAIIVDFGFNISGTRSAAENRDKKTRLNIIYSSITYIKIILFFICLAVYQVFILLNSKLSQEYFLSNFLFLIVLGEALFSQWLYLGLEKIKFAAVINLFSRFMLLLIILIGTNTSLGFFSFPLALVITSMLNGIISIYFVRKKLQIKFVRVSFFRMKRDLLKSYSFLLSRSVGVIILKLNTYLIGNYIGLAQVAYYDLAEKLINLALMPLNILNQILYPHIAKTKNFNLTFKIIFVLLIIYLAAYPFIFLFGEDVIALFAGDDMRDTYPYLLILYIIPIANIVTYFSGNCALILINRKKAFNNSIYISALFYLLVILYLLITENFNIITLCWALVLNSIVTCLYRAIACFKNKELFKKSV